MGEPSVSIIIVNYNGGNCLEECLDALLEHARPGMEIFVVDNASTDQSTQSLRKKYPTVKVIVSVVNLGYSRAINLGTDHASGDFLVLLNMDMIVQQGWLTPLVDFLEENPTAAIATPCILLYEDPDKINSLGQNVHITGLGFNRRLNYPRQEADKQPVRVSGVQGGAFAVRTSMFKELGGMNGDYFLYHEDVELSIRVSLAGYGIYAIPESVVLHRYALHMTPDKLHWLERHRWLTIFGAYKAETYFLLAPFFLLTEVLMLGYCLIRGRAYLLAKYNAVRWMLSNPEILSRSRRKSQSRRAVSDRELLSHLRWQYDWDQFVVLARQKGNWLREALSGVFSRRAYDRTA